MSAAAAEVLVVADRMAAAVAAAVAVPTTKPKVPGASPSTPAFRGEISAARVGWHDARTTGKRKTI
jgi:hypothetical protein